MKKIILVILILFSGGILTAQENNGENRLAENYKLDFAISDAPAFKILGNEPSDLFRPSSSDVVSFIVSNLMNPSDISMPSSYAAEVSPALLVDKNLTLSGFRKNYFLYNLRLSFGTMKDNKSGRYNLGVGLRSTIFDKTDLRKDEKYLNEIFELLGNRENYKKKLEKEFLETCGCLISDPATQTKLKKYLTDELKKHEDDNEKLFYDILERYKNLNWNKQKFEIAFAVLGGSRDSLVKNAELTNCAAWTTFAYPVSNWGQILVGGNLNYNSISDKGSGSLGSRMYAGNNNFKGFVEAQYKIDNNNNSKNWLLNIGAEIKLINNVWVNYYAGYGVNKINSESKSDFNSHFDLRFALK